MTYTNRLVSILGYLFGFLWKFGLAILLVTDKFPPSMANIIFAIIALGLSFVSIYNMFANLKILFEEISEDTSLGSKQVTEVYSNVKLFIQAMK